MGDPINQLAATSIPAVDPVPASAPTPTSDDPSPDNLVLGADTNSDLTPRERYLQDRAVSCAVRTVRKLLLCDAKHRAEFGTDLDDEGLEAHAQIQQAQGKTFTSLMECYESYAAMKRAAMVEKMKETEMEEAEETVALVTSKPPVRYFIFDIDGTLADCPHRLPLIDRARVGGPDWDEFFAAYDKDTPIEPVIEVAKALLAAGYQIIYLTGRPFRAEQATSRWLRAQGLPGSPIIMRADGDHRPDTETKREKLDQLIEIDTEIVGVFEDRPSMCRVWREMGLTVFQVGSGEEF